MEVLIGEIVMLAVPAYYFLQVIMAVRYRRRWLALSLVPLLVMVPLLLHAAVAFAVILAAPIAFIYLLGLALVKGWVT